jgi:hypothetical protein
VWYITYDPASYAFIASREGGILTAVAGWTDPANIAQTQAQRLALAPNAISGQSWKINRLSDGFYESVRLLLVLSDVG